MAVDDDVEKFVVAAVPGGLDEAACNAEKTNRFIFYGGDHIVVLFDVEAAGFEAEELHIVGGQVVCKNMGGDFDIGFVIGKRVIGGVGVPGVRSDVVEVFGAKNREQVGELLGFFVLAVQAGEDGSCEVADAERGGVGFFAVCYQETSCEVGAFDGGAFFEQLPEVF